MQKHSSIQYMKDLMQDKLELNAQGRQREQICFVFSVSIRKLT